LYTHAYYLLYTCSPLSYIEWLMRLSHKRFKP
jgi:hypothetical protein